VSLPGKGTRDKEQRKKSKRGKKREAERDRRKLKIQTLNTTKGEEKKMK
jgi:hypothetical protein